MKKCSRCGQLKTLDQFTKNRRRTDGYDGQCKSCQKEYRDANKPQRAAGDARRRLAAPEVFAERQRKWRVQNPEAVKRQTRKTYENYRFEIQARITARRRNTVYTLTEQEWLWLIEEYDSCCYHCGVKCENLSKDRIIPGLFGGSYSFVNVIPACKPCNDSRGAKSIEEFRQYRRKLGLPVKEW